jgi:hypothetical protein
MEPPCKRNVHCAAFRISFMIGSMDMAQSDPTRPSDPDMHWTGWALHTLRQTVEYDMRCKGLTEQQQRASLSESKTSPDFGLIQARLSRSVRLSIAMTERIRAGFIKRRDERAESGEEGRRRQRRERAAGMVAGAASRPEEGLDAERMRSLAWETLVEDEVLDAQLDTLSAAEFVQAVCRKIGHPPDPIRLPQGWDETVEAKVPAAETEAADRELVDDWSAEPDESDAGRAVPEPRKPDSS